MNQVETWFGILTRQAIRRGTFRSVKELIARIEVFTASWNEGCLALRLGQDRRPDPRQGRPQAASDQRIGTLASPTHLVSDIRAAAAKLPSTPTHPQDSTCSTRLVMAPARSSDAEHAAYGLVRAARQLSRLASVDATGARPRRPGLGDHLSPPSPCLTTTAAPAT